MTFTMQIGATIPLRGCPGERLAMIIAQVVTLVIWLAEVSPGNRQICWHGCLGQGHMICKGMGQSFSCWGVVGPSCQSSLPVPSIAGEWLDGWKIGEKVS